MYSSNSAFHPYTYRASVPRPALSRPFPNLLMNYQSGTLMVPAQDSQWVTTVTSTSGLRLSSGVCGGGGGGGSQKHTHTRAVFRGGVGGAFAPPEIAVAPPEICEAVNYLITCTHMVKTKKSIN